MRITITTLVALVLAAGAGTPVLAQDADFSGTWRLDRDASEFPQFGGGGGRGGRGGGPGGGRGGAAATVVITQSADLLTMEQQTERGSRTVTYRLDGGESTNSARRGETVSTSRWDGATLVTEGTMNLSTPRGDFSMDVVERHTLSDDGLTLTIESTRTAPFGEIATTLVYRR